MSGRNSKVKRSQSPSASGSVALSGSRSGSVSPSRSGSSRTSVSSGSLGKNLIEQKFLDPELLAGVGYPVHEYPRGTKFVQETYMSPTGRIKRSLFPAKWRARYGPMQTQNEPLAQPKNVFYEEGIRTLPSGQMVRSLVPFEGRLVYDNTNIGFSDIYVDPQNPITSKVAWAQPRARKPYPVGIFPFRAENVEDLGPTSLIPVGVVVPPTEVASPLMFRSASQASDPRSPALSRSTSVNSPRPVNFPRNLTRNLRSRTEYPGTYVIVRRNNMSKRNKKSRSRGPRGAGVGVGVGAGTGLPLPMNPYEAQGAIPGSRAGYTLV